MKHSRRFWKMLCILLAAAFVGLLLAIIICAVAVRTATYTVTLQSLSSPLRLVAVSDLHGRSFGRDNSRLLEKIRAQKPDAILLVGDMIDRSAEESDAERLAALVGTLTDIAPVFFAPGNHEQTYMKTDPTLLDRMAQAGATVVDDSYVDVTIAGQPLRIGGTMGHGFAFGRTEEEFAASPEYAFLKDFESTDVPKICLAHMPDTFIFNGAYDLWDVDLAVSGHTHGGLVRLPFVGGLYAPMQGWLPEYDRGYFRLGGHMQMVITSGLAGHGPLPRINNLPEIAVIDLVPAQ